MAGASAVLPKVAAASDGDIREDFDVLRAALDIHPGALRYLNPAALDAALTVFESEYAATEALDERYLVLSRFLSKLRCGHTYANFYNQSEAVSEALFNRKTRLPFAFRWVDGQMVITRSLSGLNLPSGAIITDINGVAPERMLQQLLPYTRADGAALGKRIALLEVQHRARIEYFDVFHGLVYGAPEDGVHRLRAILPDGRAISVNGPALDLAARKAMRDASPEIIKGDGPSWSFEVRRDIGILTMPSWSTYSFDWDWQDWLEGKLDDVIGLRGLIVDNRRNEGGDIKVGIQLLTRLIRDPVPLPDIRRLVRFRTFPEALRPHVNTWDSSFYFVGERAEAVGQGFYALPRSQSIDRLSPRGDPIDVPTVLLTSPTNSSAAFTFAYIAQASGRMKLVGTPTGGNRRGINGDGFFFTTLPVSGIEFDLPMVGQFPVEPQHDGGVIPDVQVEETAADIAAGRDPAMDAAFSLIED
ncbi:MAG: S41 family peptidase [Pseudomonadota bacterium]